MNCYIANMDIFIKTLNPYAVVSLALIGISLMIISSSIRKVLDNPHVNGRPRSNERADTSASNQHRVPEEQGDYDFLSSQEGVPSNYDIAIAYIATGQIDKAIAHLQYVISANHPIYSPKATEKLAQIIGSTH